MARFKPIKSQPKTARVAREPTRMDMLTKHDMHAPRATPAVSTAGANAVGRLIRMETPAFIHGKLDVEGLTVYDVAIMADSWFQSQMDVMTRCHVQPSDETRIVAHFTHLLAMYTRGESDAWLYYARDAYTYANTHTNGRARA